MLPAEKKCGKTYQGTRDWSPQLKQSVMAVRYWKLRLRITRGALVSSAMLAYHLSQADITPEDAIAASQTDIIRKLRSCYNLLKSRQENHKQL
jgi:uncharacterized membrane protein YkvA (DUF1232 family)